MTTADAITKLHHARSVLGAVRSSFEQERLLLLASVLAESQESISEALRMIETTLPGAVPHLAACGLPECPTGFNLSARDSGQFTLPKFGTEPTTPDVYREMHFLTDC